MLYYRNQTKNASALEWHQPLFWHYSECLPIKTKKLETLDTQGLQASQFNDSDWARTSDLYPVKKEVR
jgi:hypothetical protein